MEHWHMVHLGLSRPRIQSRILSLSHEPVIPRKSTQLHVHRLPLLGRVILGKVVHVFMVDVVSGPIEWASFQVCHIYEFAALGNVCKFSECMLLIVRLAFLEIPGVVCTPSYLGRGLIVIKHWVLMVA